jgi:nonsense-mediated mRNA decay protein 3
MNKRFCPKCGAADKPLVKGFCLNCFLKDHPDLVKVDSFLDLEQCKTCGKVRVKGHWVEPSNTNLVEFIQSETKIKELKDVEIEVELEILDEKKTQAEIMVKGVLDDAPVVLEKETLIRFKTVLCDPCMRVTSHYREAIVQVRGEKDTPKNLFEKAFRLVNTVLANEYRKDPLARIVEVHDYKFGFDVWIGSKRAGKIVAESLAREFKGKVKVSSKLHGVDKHGKEKYRFTFSVRIS